MPNDSYDLELASGRIAASFHVGERTPVVVLHGNSASKTVFISQIAALRAQGFGVLALDLPGHGDSADAKDPSRTYSFPGYAAVVADALDRFSIEHAHVIGWSLGGHVGLELMARDPRVTSLLIWGTPPVRPGADALDRAFLACPEMNYAGQRDLDADECEHYARAMAGLADGPGEALVRSVKRTDGNARHWMLRNALNGVGSDAFDLVERDERPITVIHGLDDPFVNLAFLTTPRYRNLWRGAVQVLPGIGHAAHLQAPETFNAILTASLLSSDESATTPAAVRAS